MKKLGFGLMRLPLTDSANAGSVDIEQMKEMVDAFKEAGFTYFDTAWMYCAFESENAVKKALSSRHERDSYTLADKLHCSFVDSLEGRDEIFNTQLEKTGAEYFDYYLLHAVDAKSLKKYEELQCFDWLKEKKEQGQVKHIGFSFHDSPEVLDQVLTRHPEVEFVQLQLNYLDWDSPRVQSGGCYEVARKHGKKVMVMEPVKGGTLAVLPKEAMQLLEENGYTGSPASLAIRFAASLPGVEVVLSGMSNVDQMQDNLSYMKEFQPLSGEEKELARQCAHIIRSQTAIDCTGCSYCTEGCPEHIAIPQYFSLLNEDMRETNGQGRPSNRAAYQKLNEEFGKAEECIACGQCEGVCPQHLPIIDNLKKISKRYDG